MLYALDRKRFARSSKRVKRKAVFSVLRAKFRGRRSTGFRKIARAVETRKGFSVGRADL